MKKNFYNADFVRLCISLVPVRLRKGLLKIFITCFSEMIKEIHKDFTDWREDFFYKSVKESTITDLEVILNRLYDPQKERIRIINGENIIDHVLLYKREYYERGLIAPLTTPVIIHKRLTGLNGTGIDFYIQVPKDIYTSYTLNEGFKKEFDEKVNAYKPAGKTYKVVKNNG